MTYAEYFARWSTFIDSRRSEKLEQQGGVVDELPQADLSYYWGEEVFTQDNVIAYCAERALTAKGRIEDKLQVETLCKEVQAFIAEARRRNPTRYIPPTFRREVKATLCELAGNNWLSAKVRPAAVFGYKEAARLVETSLKHDEGSMAMQTGFLIATIAHTGTRISSLCAQTDIPEKYRKYLQWKCPYAYTNMPPQPMMPFPIYPPPAIPWHYMYHYPGQQLPFQAMASMGFMGQQGLGLMDQQRSALMGQQGLTPVEPQQQQQQSPSVGQQALDLQVQQLAHDELDIVDHRTPSTHFTQHTSSAIEQGRREAHSLAVSPVSTRHSSQHETSIHQDDPWNISYDSTPLCQRSTDAANYKFKRLLIKSGLTIDGTLYAFRRNFANILHKTGDDMAARRVMGHSAGSHTIEKAYISKN